MRYRRIVNVRATSGTYRRLAPIGRRFDPFRVKFRCLSFRVNRYTGQVNRLPNDHVLRRSGANFIIHVHGYRDQDERVVRRFLLNFRMVLSYLVVVRIVAHRVNGSASIRQRTTSALLISQVQASFRGDVLTANFRRPDRRVVGNSEIEHHVVDQSYFTVSVVTGNERRSCFVPRLPRRLMRRYHGYHLSIHTNRSGRCRVIQEVLVPNEG